MMGRRKRGRWTIVLALAILSLQGLAFGVCRLPAEPPRSETYAQTAVLSPRRLSARRRLRCRRRLRAAAAAVCLLTALALGCVLFSGRKPEAETETAPDTAPDTVRILEPEPVKALSQADKLRVIGSSPDYPADLVGLAERNAETVDFVYDYPANRGLTQTIDLTREAASGTVPLLMQWDERWGYEAYGDSLIALSGCGPVCLSMAAIYLREDAVWTPPAVCRFAEENGYRVENSGTSWTLISEGSAALGLRARELPLSEDAIRQALDAGSAVIAVVGPGDFTRDGHFLVLTGCDADGLRLNDPNSRANSEKTWSYDVLSPQIRNLWALSPA